MPRNHCSKIFDISFLRRLIKTSIAARNSAQRAHTMQIFSIDMRQSFYQHLYNIHRKSMWTHVRNNIDLPDKGKGRFSAMAPTHVTRCKTHTLQQKRYRKLTPDLDSNSSRHVHLNEHQEDILPRKRPKACILEKLIESSETWNQRYRIQRMFCASWVNNVHVHNDPSLKFNKCKCWTQGKSQHQRSLQTRKNHPWASQSE